MPEEMDKRTDGVDAPPKTIGALSLTPQDWSA